MVKEHSLFVCLDDKHRIKIGEPGCAVATAERGHRVLVAQNERCLVGDHDLTTFSVVPSILLVVDIPEEITGLMYTGQVFVGLKDAAFEPSSPMQHTVELCEILRTSDLDSAPIIFMYTNGGPDHCLTYISVHISLACLFIKMDLDYMCTARTAPYHSWHNPVE